MFVVAFIVLVLLFMFVSALVFSICSDDESVILDVKRLLENGNG